MYLHFTAHGVSARDHAAEPKPTGPGLKPEEALKVVKLEIWATTVDEPGPDRCEFRCFDSIGKLIHTVTVDGY